MLKRYTDLSTTELSNLNSDQVELLIDLEAILKGIKPVAEPVEPEINEFGLKKSETYWMVKADEYSSNTNLAFVSEVDASLVAKMETVKLDYDWGMGDKFRYATPVNPLIQKIQVYSKSDIDKNEASLKANKGKKSAYTEAKEEYDKYSKAISEIRIKIGEAITSAKSSLKDITDAQANYSKCLLLAENDEAKAKELFRNIYKDDSSIIATILGE